MMLNRRLLIPFFLFPVAVFLLTGCLGSREVNDMAIISGAAFDRNSKTGIYEVSAEIVNKNANASEGGSEPEKIQAYGKTIADAIQNCSYTDSRKAYWSHAKIFVISQEMAKEQGISPLLDYVIRNYKARLSIDLLVSGLSDAGSVLDLSTASTNIKAFDLEEMLKTDLRSAGAAPLKVYQAVDLLNTEGIEMTIPIVQERSVVHASDENSDTESGSASDSAEGAPSNAESPSAEKTASKDEHDNMAVISGTAAFRGDKLVGTLTREETVILLFLQDRIQQTHLALPKKQVSVDIRNSKTKITPSCSQDEITLVIEIKADASISQLQGSSLTSKQQREKMAEEIGNAISSDCIALIKKTQSELKTDLFGFGKLIRETNPEIWSQVHKNWNTDGFSKVNVAVKTSIYLDPGETTAGQTTHSAE